MARPARLEFAGACYHVMNRGNMQGNIFIDNVDRHKFYEIIGKIETRYGILIYAFVLMGNHYHLLLETLHPNLSRAVQRLNGAYAFYFNRRHKRPGHLFQGRFKAMLVEKDAYLLELSRYIHLNPLRAGIVKSPDEYRWSSLSVYSSGRSRLPFRLHWEWILSMFGKREKVASTRYMKFIHECGKKEPDPGLKAKGGWVLGSEKWTEKVLKKTADFSSRELTGTKPLKPGPSVDNLEKLVCKEFQVGIDSLKSACYKNIARQTAIYLSVDFCGLTLKQAGQRYGMPNYFAVGKSASRFRNRLLEDRELKRRVGEILSNVKM